MQTIRTLVALTDKHYAKDTAAAFNGTVISTFGHLDDGLHLFLDATFGDVIHELFKDAEAFQNFVHTNHVTVETVATFAHHFVELHTVVSRIRTRLAQVVVPTSCATRTARTTVRNRLFLGQHAYTLRTVLENHVARKQGVEFLQTIAQIRNQLLHACHEVGVKVVHHTTNRVVVQDEASATSFFEDVENLFAVAEPIKEGCRSPKVLCQAREEEQVGVDTLQLIHHGANHLHAVADFYAQRLLNTHAERMAVLHGTEVVHTVGQRQCLGIGERLVNLFNTAVDIAKDGVNLLNGFPFECHTEVEHTVGRGVLRTDVHHIIAVCKNRIAPAGNRTIGIQCQFFSIVRQGFVGHAERIVLLRLIILTERITHPVFAQEYATHIGVTRKADAVEVKYFALVNVCHCPKVRNTGE